MCSWLPSVLEIFAGSARSVVSSCMTFCAAWYFSGFFPGRVASEVIHVRLHQILRAEHRGVVLERALDERPELKVDGRPVRRRAQ